jgi:hypothetical protein
VYVHRIEARRRDHRRRPFHAEGEGRKRLWRNELKIAVWGGTMPYFEQKPERTVFFGVFRSRSAKKSLRNVVFSLISALFRPYSPPDARKIIDFRDGH